MKDERGSATLVVLILVSVLLALVIVNGGIVHQLRGELRRIDHQQQKKFALPPS